MTHEPENLLWTNGSPAAIAILEAISDGGIDTRAYGYQPVIYTKLPSLADGDATRREVSVERGQLVVDAVSKQVVPLAKGVWLAQLQGDALLYDGRSDSARTVQLAATWTLVPGLTWHDGVPVTADDQVFMYEVSKSPETPSLKYVPERTQSFEAQDERTTVWTGLPGFDDPTYFLNVWHPLPRHAYGAMSAAELLADERVNRSPLGYGPFRIIEWTPGESIRLEAARDTYWRASEALPRLEGLIVRFVDDTDRLPELVAGGECGLVTEEASLESDLPAWRALEAQQRLTLHVNPGPVVEMISFNAMPAADSFGFAASAINQDGSPAFADGDVRRAIALCIDRQALVEQALAGAGVVLDTYVPTNHPFYPDDPQTLRQHPFDPARGRQLLEARGWIDGDGDGIRERDGHKFSLSIAMLGNPTREAVGALLQVQLWQCQIEATPAPYGSELLSPGPGGALFGRQFDLASLAWPLNGRPPCDRFMSDRIPNETNGWGQANVSGYANLEFDAACEATLAAEDVDEAVARHAHVLSIFAQDLPALPLYARVRLAAASPALVGFEVDPTASVLWNVEAMDWEI